MISGKEVLFVWETAHTDLTYKEEKVDKLAKQSITSGTNNITELPFKYSWIVPRNSIFFKWQSKWKEFSFVNPDNIVTAYYNPISRINIGMTSRIVSSRRYVNCVLFISSFQNRLIVIFVLQICITYFSRVKPIIGTL